MVKKLGITAFSFMIAFVCMICSGCGNELVLDVEIAKKIKQDYFQQVNESDIVLEDVYVYKYYGTYNESVVVIMAINGFSPPPSIDRIQVAEFEFMFNTGLHITVWRDSFFYNLQNAYDGCLLTIENLQEIHNLYNA